MREDGGSGFALIRPTLRFLCRCEAEMSYRLAGNDGGGRPDNALRIDAVVAVEIGDGAGLAEMLDAERARAMAVDRAQPGKRGRMAVDDRDDAAMRGTSASSRSIWLRAWISPRSRARCAAVQPALRRSAEVMASRPTSRRSSAEQADGLDRFRRDGARIGDDDLRIRAGRRSQ